MKQVFLALVLTLLPIVAFAQQNTDAKLLQDVSVTVMTDSGSGSGIIITRDIKANKDSEKTEKINFCVTAAHVVDGLRSVRTVVDSKTGQERKIVDFKPVFIVKDLTEDGRDVGQLRMEGKVIAYSESEDGHDLAVIMLLKKNFIAANTEFYLDGNKQVDLGVRLWHVGSRRGIVTQSMTDGIMSKVGIVLTINNRPILFDSVTTPIELGSSGGGVFLAEGNHKAKCIGIVVRGGSSTLSFIVPVRRMYEYFDEKNMEWVLDTNVAVPTMEEINKIPVE